MFEILGTIASSILGGGVTGILGVVVQRFADFKNKQLDLQLSKQKFDQEIKLREIDYKIMAQEWASRTQIADIEATGREAVADAHGFAASFIEPVKYSEKVRPSRSQGWVLVVLDFVRGMVRPSLTIYLCVITTLMYIHARDYIGGDSLVIEDAFELLKLIIGTVLYLTTTCVLWWFGTRNKQPAPKI